MDHAGEQFSHWPSIFFSIYKILNENKIGIKVNVLFILSIILTFLSSAATGPILSVIYSAKLLKLLIFINNFYIMNIQDIRDLSQLFFIHFPKFQDHNTSVLILK